MGFWRVFWAAFWVSYHRARTPYSSQAHAQLAEFEARAIAERARAGEPQPDVQFYFEDPEFKDPVIVKHDEAPLLSAAMTQARASFRVRH